MPNNQRKSEKTSSTVAFSCTPTEKAIIEQARKIAEIEQKKGKLSLSDFLRDMIIIKCQVQVAVFNEKQEKRRQNRKAAEWKEIH